jgi:hypothetical protein
MLAWLNRHRRLTIRDERRDGVHQACPSLGRVLLCHTGRHRDRPVLGGTPSGRAIASVAQAKGERLQA